MSLYPSYLLVSSKRYRQEQAVIQPTPRYRVVWDDENPDWNFKCRTQDPEWTLAISAPPAVNRFYPVTKEGAGDFRVNISAWENFFKQLNNDTTGQKFNYWTSPTLAQFNQTGWPMLAYLVFCGNRLQGERVGSWFKFETLKLGDLEKAQGMTLTTHPHLIHRFTCVKWKDGQTMHIESTGTPRGDIHYPVITKEGFGYIPWRHVVEI